MSSSLPLPERETASAATPPAQRAVPAASTAGEATFAPVRGREQDVVATQSRRAEPRAWMRAVVWLVGAGLHAKAGPTTVVVARELASRMDYRRGIVLYDLTGTARRLEVSVATVKRHVAVLRELGALVWMVHGSKRNLRLPGRPYTATATVYGAVIPPAFDAAMGHRLSGSGYEARVSGVTEAGRELAVAASRGKPVDNRAVDKRSSRTCAPHSRGRYHRSPEVGVESGSNNTSRMGASPSTTSPRPHKTSRKADGSCRTAAQVRHSMWITRQVRARVAWTQRARLRRLEFVLRPLTDAGLDADTIAAELHSWMLTWRPARPAEYIRAQLDRQAVMEHLAEQVDVTERWDETEASGAFVASSPGLIAGILEGLAQGMAAYSAQQAAHGLDDLSAGTFR